MQERKATDFNASRICLLDSAHSRAAYDNSRWMEKSLIECGLQKVLILLTTVAVMCSFTAESTIKVFSFKKTKKLNLKYVLSRFRIRNRITDKKNFHTCNCDKRIHFSFLKGRPLKYITDPVKRLLHSTYEKTYLSSDHPLRIYMYDLQSRSPDITTNNTGHVKVQSDNMCLKYH